MYRKVTLPFLFLLSFVLLTSTLTGSWKDAPTEQTFTDERDGKEYAWIEINGLFWMQENLQYQAEAADCYDDDPENCRNWGRLYPFKAIASACPQGWRLPTKSDWKSLKKAMKSSKADAILLPGVWEGEDFGGANNALGLSVLPAGRKDGNTPEWRASQYGEKGISATFWLDDPGFEEHWHIRWGKSHTHRHGDLRQQKRKFSIRCVCEKLPG